MYMAIGLRFRGRGGGKSLAPDSRASSRRSKRQGASRSAGVNRGDQAAQWKRGEATLGSGKRDAASLFFGPANTGKKKAGAPASALAVLTGRGAYMKKYGKERKKIFHSFMKEKGKMLARQRRQSAKIRTDLRRQDVDVTRNIKSQLPCVRGNVV